MIEKGGKVRRVQYDGQFQKLMERLVRETPNGSIFAGVNQQTTYSQIKKIAEKSGFNGRGLHGMRKNFAVKKHAEYFRRIQELSQSKNWRLLVKEFPVSEQKAKRICSIPKERAIDVLARLRLTHDLGHNRVEVTYRYVPRGEN
ncbi:hypothetical protein N752_29875 [Desulforamulus aquiferis]|nr:hypothetical protein N752_29875 [Desulforamulus aquiferis]